MQQTLKIAMIHRDLPCEYNRGGVAYHAHYLANILTKRGHQVTFYSADPKPKDAEYKVHQIKVPDKIKQSKLFETYLFSFYVGQQDFSAFDLLHAHGDNQFLHSRKVPIVRTFYGSALGEAFGATRLARKLSQLSLYPLEFLAGKMASKSTAISCNTLRHLPVTDTVIPCGVDLETFKPSNKKSANPSILFVGTLGGRKRGQLLVDVFKSHVKPIITHAELWMVCQEEVQEEGITWFGKVPLEELIALYQRAWAFCLPSSYEGFGIPYIEAMACGTPVVATPNPGAREVLKDGEFGIICSEDELGQTLIDLLQNAVLRQKLIRSGLDHVRQYSWEKVASCYEQIYTSIAKNHHC